MAGVTDFGRCVTGFLTVYLVGERGMSDKTVKSYGLTVRAFVRHLESALGVRPESARLSDVTADVVRGFLDAVEASGCCASTRNQRLAAVKSLVRYAVREVPEFMLEGQRILAIPSKKVPQREVEYLEQDALEALLASPDLTTETGRRELALMSMLYDSAARVQELIGLQIGDVRLGPLACATIHGKGNKFRTVPVMESTAAHIARHLEDRSLPRDGSRSSLRLFCSPGRSCYTRQGIAKMLERHLERARAANPEIWFPEGIHPHMLRASKAIHLLDAGVNLIAIRDFLGHSSIVTTQKYLRVNSRTKMETVAAIAPRIEVPAPPDWKNDSDLMEFLNRICS